MACTVEAARAAAAEADTQAQMARVFEVGCAALVGACLLSCAASQLKPPQRAPAAC